MVALDVPDTSPRLPPLLHRITRPDRRAGTHRHRDQIRPRESNRTQRGEGKRTATQAYPHPRERAREIPKAEISNGAVVHPGPESTVSAVVDLDPDTGHGLGSVIIIGALSFFWGISSSLFWSALSAADHGAQLPVVFFKGARRVWPSGTRRTMWVKSLPR